MNKKISNNSKKETADFIQNLEQALSTPIKGSRRDDNINNGFDKITEYQHLEKTDFEKLLTLASLMAGLC